MLEIAVKWKIHNSFSCYSEYSGLVGQSCSIPLWKNWEVDCLSLSRVRLSFRSVVNVSLSNVIFKIDKVLFSSKFATGWSIQISNASWSQSSFGTDCKSLYPVELYTDAHVLYSLFLICSSRIFVLEYIIGLGTEESWIQRGSWWANRPSTSHHRQFLAFGPTRNISRGHAGFVLMILSTIFLLLSV